MKANKLFRKLALSGVALGAAAVTLTATTFAWYTSNTEADVTTVTAQTEAKSSASLFIATANDYDGEITGVTGYKQATGWNEYLAKATPTLTAGSSYTLKPVYSNYGTINATVNGRAYNKIDGFTNSGAGTEQSPYTSTASYANEVTADFLEFVFRVRSSGVLAEETNLYFTEFNITAADTDSNVSSAQIPLATNGTTGITSKSAYSASLLNALKLDITSKAVDLDENSAIPDLGVTTRKAGDNGEVDAVTTYGFEAQGTHSNNMNVNDSGNSAGNAVGYYNTVMGSHFDLTGPAGYVKGTETTLINRTTMSTDEIASATEGKTPVVVAKLPATDTDNDDEFSVVEIRFVLYLDGWDNYCYDIMQGQTVNFSFQVSTQSAKAVLYKPTV